MGGWRGAPHRARTPHFGVSLASHIYFDFFGTLVDYSPSVHPETANAPLAFAARAGLSLDAVSADALWQRAWTELDSEANVSGRECSMLEIAARFSELIGAPDSASAELSRLVTDYLAAWTANHRLAESVRSCLEDLASDHVLSVVSNTHDAGLVPAQLARFGIDHFFADVFTSIDIGWRKPRREIFDAVLAKHDVSAADAVFVGDNWEADVVGPAAVGMRSFYVGTRGPGRVPVALGELPQRVRTR